ncbi:Gustatory receptor, partial [Aphis craccivora]
NINENEISNEFNLFFSGRKYNIIKMTSVFKITLEPILTLCKIIGLMNISYTLEPTGLLIWNMDSTSYSLLECTRMIVLLILTYFSYKDELYYVIYYRVVRFWIVIIAARLSERWTIKLINGIIQFDQKVDLLSPAFMVHQNSISKKKWNIILAVLFLYYVGFRIYDLYLWPPTVYNFNTLLFLFFGIPYILDYVIIIIVYFYLINIACRFKTLNDFWECLPLGLVSVPGEWTYSELAMLIESIRLLHAELSQLFNIFNYSFGKMLLVFFVFCIIDIMYLIYLMIELENVIKHVPLHILIIQIVVFLMFIILAATSINEKKIKIISYLRLIPISKLPVEIKTQLNLALKIKMFLYQISLLNLDEITAFGFFNINLNLVVSVMLLITGFSTIMQMKNHPIILKTVANTKMFHKNWILSGAMNVLILQCCVFFFLCLCTGESVEIPLQFQTMGVVSCRKMNLRREKPKKILGKTGIFTQNQFSTKSIFLYGCNSKTNHCKYLKFSPNIYVKKS